MSEGGPRRVAVVVGLYVVGASVVLTAAAWVRRALALPELFETLLLWGLLAGAPVAAALAWRYPQLGHGDDTAGPSDPR